MTKADASRIQSSQVYPSANALIMIIINRDKHRLSVVGICPPKASPLEHSLLLIEMLFVMQQVVVEQKAKEMVLLIAAETVKAGLNAVLCSSPVSPEGNRRICTPNSVKQLTP